jgi:multidrug efflux pump subunit AcrA (membrane-fusion protein)
MGKTLFEIAPLNIMVVELAVPEADVRHVTIGMEIDLQLEAMPERTIHAVIRSIHPRAELREGENVFIAEADVANDDLTMLPGMRGTARIHADRHTIGWNLFHKPTAWLLGWLGW